MDQEEKPIIIPTINMTIIRHNGVPALELRKVITDTETIKDLVTKAYMDQQTIIQPNFTNKALAINKLLQSGLITRNEEQYEFIF